MYYLSFFNDGINKSLFLCIFVQDVWFDFLSIRKVLQPPWKDRREEGKVLCFGKDWFGCIACRTSKSGYISLYLS